MGEVYSVVVMFEKDFEGQRVVVRPIIWLLRRCLIRTLRYVSLLVLVRIRSRYTIGGRTSLSCSLLSYILVVSDVVAVAIPANIICFSLLY